ncbi:outer membrane lipoprotein carrier protein LolA [uncultured Amnibacterium sp.]|uniref:LolA family protein n=1 Tax=uncultured Amnibacterium sp. TaxID=1631851 RepID=UPI0035C95229
MSHRSAPSRRLGRWVPAIAAPVVVLGVVVAMPLSAGAAPSLPAKTPQQVLDLIATSTSVKALSGTVSQTSDLGLPALPTTGADSDSSTAAALNLLTGSHTFRVFAAGRSDRRVQVLDSSGERDVVQHGTSIWSYDSAKDEADHVTIDPSKLPAHRDAPGDGAAGTVTPDQAATQLLAKLAPSSTVTTDTNASVAGRDAYVLKIVPKTAATTVGSVEIAVDAETGLPLRVQVVPRGTTSPAVSIGYTAISYATPPASTFLFTAPNGATVHTSTVPKHDLKRVERGSYKPLAIAAKPTVTGTGWASVVTVPKGRVPASVTSSPLYSQATTAVAGGRAISTSLVNVLITTDGRVLAGAVPLSTLQADAAE